MQIMAVSKHQSYDLKEMTHLGFLHWGLSSTLKSPSAHPQQVSVLTDRKVNIIFVWLAVLLD